MVTITNLGMPTVSASGANIGIDSTAKPDDDGTIKPRKKKMTNSTIINNGHSYVARWKMRSAKSCLRLTLYLTLS